MKAWVLGILFVSSVTFASGKLQIKPSYSLKSEKFGGQVGLSIYEPLLLGINYNGWLGAGIQPRVGEDSAKYAVFSSFLETWFGRTGLGVGYVFKKANVPVDELFSDHSIEAKLMYSIW